MFPSELEACGSVVGVCCFKLDTSPFMLDDSYFELKFPVPNSMIPVLKSNLRVPSLKLHVRKSNL